MEQQPIYSENGQTSEIREWLLAWLEVILELPKNQRILKDLHDREINQEVCPQREPEY